MLLPYVIVYCFRCECWKAYTLSYYDCVLVKLVTIKGNTEDHKYCKTFFPCHQSLTGTRNLTVLTLTCSVF